MMRTHWAVIGVFALVACQPADVDVDDDVGEEEVTDLRRPFPSPSEDAITWETPEWTIPAQSERQMCVAHTYGGEAVGIRAQRNYQSPMGHHVTLFGTTVSDREMPDGEQWDCTSLEALSMTDLEPIMIGGSIVEDEDGSLNEFILPDGMGAVLKAGQRIVIQSHYLNTTQSDILVGDAVHLDVIPEAEVEIWAAPLVNTVTDLHIPANTDGYNVTFDCEFEDPYTVLYIGGHLHEWGDSFQTRYTPNGGTEEVIYDIPVWDPVLRDAPQYTDYLDGDFTVDTGDVFTTSCTWNNDEDHELEFPEEMCVTFGMIYPSKVPVICAPDE